MSSPPPAFLAVRSPVTRLARHSPFRSTQGPFQAIRGYETARLTVPVVKPRLPLAILREQHQGPRFPRGPVRPPRHAEKINQVRITIKGMISVTNDSTRRIRRPLITPPLNSQWFNSMRTVHAAIPPPVMSAIRATAPQTTIAAGTKLAGCPAILVMRHTTLHRPGRHRT